MGAYIALIVMTMAIGGFVSWYCHHNLKKYGRVGSSLGITGYQAAQMMLRANGVSGVRVYMGSEGNDHFDPRDNSISLSPSVYQQPTVTAVATACHEVGHACQYAQGYSFFKIRAALVPVASFAENTWIFIFMAGLIFNLAGLVEISIAIYACAILFQIVTLPVEFNASHRAMDYIKSLGVSQSDAGGSFAVLRSCALTYVGAALISILNLLYYLSIFASGDE